MNLSQRSTLGLFLGLAFISLEHLIKGKTGSDFLSAGAALALFLFIISSKSPGEPE